MPHSDFDVPRLAAFLHLTPKQVLRLADRGKIPGRKINGQWRFSRAEIHHWLEERIGLSSDVELREVEGVIHRAAGGPTAEVSIDLWMPDCAVIYPLQARTRFSVIQAMCDLAATTGLLWEPGKMAEAVQAREEMHTTALDMGVALLHARRPMTNILGGPILALGRTVSGIPFAGRGLLTDIFFLICSTDDQEHLQLLARLSRVLTDPEIIPLLREAADSADLRRIIVDKEAEIY